MQNITFAHPQGMETYSCPYGVDYEASTGFIILPRMRDEDR